MRKNKKPSTKERFEIALKKRAAKKYIFNLYVAGLSPRSQDAIRNIKKLCDIYLKGRYQLKIQDIYKNPIFAKNGQILAAPTLVKTLPPPIREFIGDMSNTEKMLVGLDLRSK